MFTYTGVQMTHGFKKFRDRTECSGYKIILVGNFDHVCLTKVFGVIFPRHKQFCFASKHDRNKPAHLSTVPTIRNIKSVSWGELQESCGLEKLFPN